MATVFLPKAAGLFIALRLAPFFNALTRLSSHIRLTLGTRGAALAGAACMVAFVCCVVAMCNVGTSLRRSDLDYRKAQVVEIFELNTDYRRWLDGAASLSASAWQPTDGTRRLADAWSAFQRRLTAVCAASQSSQSRSQLAALCDKDRTGYLASLAAEVETASQRKTRLSPETEKKFLEVRNDLDTLSDVSVKSGDALLTFLVDGQQQALNVLFATTLGFMVAGCIFVALVGHASVQNYRHTTTAEKAASEARRFADILRETIEILPAGVVLYGEDDRLMLFNSSAASIAPVLNRPGAIGKTQAELVKDYIEYRESIAAPLADEDVHDWVLQFKDEGVRIVRQVEGGRWFEWSGRRTPSGRTVGLRADVTELKNREIEIARMRDEFEELVAALSEVVFRLDMDSGKLTFVSASAQALFGMSPADLMTGRLYDFVVAEDVEKLRWLAREEYAATDHGIRKSHFRITTVAGQEKHVEARYRRLPGEGRPEIAGVLRDIEAQTWLADRLDEERSHLRSIVESTGALVLLADRDFTIVMANSEFAELTGVDVDALSGRPMSEVVDWPIDSDRLQEWRDGRCDPDRRLRAQFTVRHIEPAGHERIFNVTVRPILGEEGKAKQYVFIGVDDTERRHAEQALSVTERLAALGEMSAAIAHEIAQPLQVINLACQSALDELGQHTAAKDFDVGYTRQKLTRIANQIERSNRIVGDLRAFVRGAAADEQHPFDPLDAVRAALDLTAHSLRESGTKLWLTLENSSGKVFGHGSKLEQVLVNLINNARDSGGSQIDVVLSIVSQGRGGDAVRITVQDNGPGIAPEVLNRLFNAFITTKPRGKGTGLGLRVCKRIVEEMRGAITGGNRAEGGARFDIVLPLIGDQDT